MAKREPQLRSYLRLYHPLSVQERPIFIKQVVYLLSEGTTLHMHYAPEAAVLLRGRIRRIYQDCEYDCVPGDVWFCGIWEPHGFRVLEEPCSSVVFIASPEFLSRLRFPEERDFEALAPFMAHPSARPRVTDSRRREMLKLGARAVELYNSSERFQHLRTRLLFLELLLRIEEECDPPSRQRESHRGGVTRAAPGDRRLRSADAERAAETVNRAVRSVFASNRYLPESQVAAECGLGRTTFSRLFKQVMGMGFAMFALRYRLSMAAESLLTTDGPLKAIATEWGFADTAHLDHAFRRHYGCSPTQYRSRTDENPLRQSVIG